MFFFIIAFCSLKRTISVFLVLREILFALSQWAIIFNAKFIFWLMFLRDLLEQIKFVSPTKWCISTCIVTIYFAYFLSVNLESLSMDLSKAETKLFREYFSASVSALNCESCLSRSFCMQFFSSLIESLDSIVKFTKKIKEIKINLPKFLTQIRLTNTWI